jgi:hypothetical protein
VIRRIEALSKSKAKNASEYKQILSKIAKKSLTGDKALDITFTGSSVLYNRKLKPLNDYDSEEIKRARNTWNKQITENRTKWVQNGDN